MLTSVEPQGGCVVLLVDDDQELLDVVATLLEMGRCQVLRATTGGEALPLLLRTINEGRRPCLVLLDLMLPDERGEDVYARLRTLAVPVVVMSAAADGALRAERIGVPFLSKPFDIDQFFSTLQAHCPAFVTP